MFIVMCRVSGGVTGTREAKAKDKDGKVYRFETREEAQKLADEWTKRMNHSFSVADFYYWVEEE